MWNEQDGTLSLHWNSSSPLLKKCVVYMVRNLKDTRQVRPEIPYDDHFAFKLPTVSSSSLFCSQSLNVTGTSYSLSQVSQNKPYVFQVRSTVAEECSASDLWSDWSTPVEWGTGRWDTTSTEWDMDGFALICRLTVFSPSRFCVREQQTRRVAGVLCCSVSPSALSAGFDVLSWEVRDV